MIFSNNPFYDLKDKLVFDKLYSEKDFEKDCVWVQRLKNKKLLSEVNIQILSRFWISRLEEPDRNIRKIAQDSLTYFRELKRIEKLGVIDKK